jgi:hypothetical protein
MAFGLDEYDHLWLWKGDKYPPGPCAPTEPGYLQIKRNTLCKIVDAKAKPYFVRLKKEDGEDARRITDGKRMRYKLLRAMPARKFAICQIARNEYPLVGTASRRTFSRHTVRPTLTETRSR